MINVLIRKWPKSQLRDEFTLPVSLPFQIVELDWAGMADIIHKIFGPKHKESKHHHDQSGSKDSEALAKQQTEFCEYC